jgi:hypothetical protein
MRNAKEPNVDHAPMNHQLWRLTGDRLPEGTALFSIDFGQALRFLTSRRTLLRIPFKIEAFQCLDTGKGHTRWLPFYVPPIFTPLGCDRRPQLEVVAGPNRNVTVPMDFAIVG